MQVGTFNQERKGPSSRGLLREKKSSEGSFEAQASSHPHRTTCPDISSRGRDRDGAESPYSSNNCTVSQEDDF